MSDARANIFYDYNDTGYYLDPASTSELNKVYYNSNMVSRNYGIGQVGLYDSTRFQAVFSMGEAYLLAANGTGVGNLYGIAWSHPNAGGAAGNLASHGMLILENGSFKGAWGGGRIVTTSDIRGTIFYDYDDTGYYLDPNSTSNSALRMRGGTLHGPNTTWGAYLSVGTNGHVSGSYASACATNGNLHLDAATGFHTYINNYAGTDTYIRYLGNDRLLIFGSSDYTQASGSLRAPLFYDANNTGFYTDPASTSRLTTVQADVYYSPYAGGNSGLSRSSYPYGFGFQENGAWTGAYPDLVVQFHTGLTFAANSSYEGMRFKADYNSDTLIFQVNGGSNYLYKYYWMYTNTTGFYSDTNGAHFTPNTGSSYGSWQIQGSRNGWRGIQFFEGGNVPHLMFDGSANGGIYYETGGRWAQYYHYGNVCQSINTSTSSSSYGLYVNGAIYSTGNIVAYSDVRKKENIVTVDNALEKVNNLRGVYYNRIDDETKTRQIGVIAQEINTVIPEVVTHAKDVDEYGVSYGNLAGLFIEALKEQTNIINNLKAEIDELKLKLENR
jgi:hypothetical protein